MNFEDALRRLAEREPEKFSVDAAPDGFRERFPDAFSWPDISKKKRTYVKSIVALGQDDIDEILASIGWEYCVDRDWNLPPEKPWFYEFWRAGKQREPFGSGKNGVFPDKLSAAKAALIEIVEKQYPAETMRVK